MPDPGRIPGPFTIPNCVELVLVWSLANSKRASNVLHLQVLDSFTCDTATADAINNPFIADARFDAWMANVGTVISYLGLTLRDKRELNTAAIPSTAAAEPGTDGTDPLPPEVSFVVTARTGSAGRAFRGRTYLPGVAVDKVTTTGAAVAGVLSTAPDFLNALGDATAAQGGLLAIGQPARAAYVSPDTGLAIPARAAGTVPIVEFDARDNIFDSQRRRSAP